MMLSDGLIYFGVICLLLGLFIIVADHMQYKTASRDKNLADRILFYKNKFLISETSILSFTTALTCSDEIVTSAVTGLFPV